MREEWANDFPYERMPRYDGPGEARPFDSECCTAKDCPQRDYNRACILALENLSRAYASLHLLRSAASRLWNCDDEGHTADCPNPACRFGMDMAVSLDRVRRHYASVVVDLCRVLTVPAADLEALWQPFFDTEQAREVVETVVMGVDEDDSAANRIAVSTIKQAIRVWQLEAVGEDPLELVRWFSPPADEDAAPN
jgi:hypothetical protein